MYCGNLESILLWDEWAHAAEPWPVYVFTYTYSDLKNKAEYYILKPSDTVKLREIMKEYMDLHMEQMQRELEKLSAVFPDIPEK